MSGENKPTDQLQERLDKLNKELNRIPYIDLIEEKTKVKPIFLLLGLLCSFVTLVAFDFSVSGAIIQFIGVLYPIFKSIEAIESENKEDDAQWLTYWMVFSLINVIETVLSLIT